MNTQMTIPINKAIEDYLIAQRINKGFLGNTIGNHFNILVMNYGSYNVLKEITKQAKFV